MAERTEDLATNVEDIIAQCRHHVYGPVFCQRCEAGIAYDEVRGSNNDGNQIFPCTLYDDEVASIPCANRDPFTRDEAEARLKQIRADGDKFLAQIRVVRPLIVDHFEPGSEGLIDCPYYSGRIHFTVAASNGHVHARCNSTDCVNWME
ncbi:MAG: hypothetical protein GY937_10080 [bacterium]|nr:hypothetical protein [bacterium]